MRAVQFHSHTDGTVNGPRGSRRGVLLDQWRARLQLLKEHGCDLITGPMDCSTRTEGNMSVEHLRSRRC